MGTRLTAVGVTVAIGLGGFAVAATNPLGIAGAQDAPGTADGPRARSGPLADALDALVADGTLTPAQADAVTTAVRGERHGGREARRTRRAETLAAAAEAIGATPAEVRSARRGGTSIAAQAEAAGVDRQVVDDALTAAITEHLAAAVEAGTITEARAAEATAKLGQVVDRLLDADGSRRPG